MVFLVFFRVESLPDVPSGEGGRIGHKRTRRGIGMKSQNAGFTLIELVVVIVILGVLAAVAAPRFIDLSGEAESAAVTAQASALTSASAINFAAYTLDQSGSVTAYQCDDGGSLLAGGLDSQYTITNSSASGASGAAVSCGVSSGSASASWTLISTGS